jgi:predicted transcriptional regulator
LKVNAKQEADSTLISPAVTDKLDHEFTDQQLKEAWLTFAESRKAHQADYHLLNQPFERSGVKIIVPLANPVQETMLNEFRTELNTFLREKLQNNSIQVVGELRLPDDKKIIYTNRDKFDYLTTKNPIIKELKDRLGLDPDF